MNVSAPIFRQESINHQEQAALYKSKNNFTKAVNLLNLDIKIDGKYILETEEKYFDSIYTSEPDKHTSLDITLQNENYSVTILDKTFKNLEYNELNNVLDLELRLNRSEASYVNKSIKITKNTIKKEVRYLTYNEAKRYN